MVRTYIRFGGGALAFGAALLSNGGAAAQTGGGAGAPGGNDRFAFTPHARVFYETNVSGGDDTIASLRQLQPEDTTYNLGASVAFQLPSARRSVFLTGSADFDRHEKNKSLNADNYAVTLGGSSQVGLCIGSGVATYSHRQALIQDLTVLATSNIVDQRSANLSVTCGRRGIVAGVSGGISRLDNNVKGSATTAAFVDSETRNLSGSLGYENKVLGNLSLVALYSSADYGNRPVTGVVAATGFSQYGGGVNYSRKIGNRLSGNAGVNYTKLESDSTALLPGVTSNSLGANVALQYRASSRLGFSLGYDLGNQASALADAAFVRTSAFRFSSDYRLNSRVSLTTGVSKAKTDYHGGQSTILQIRQSDDFSVSGSVAVRIGQKISLTLDASHTDRKADLHQFNYRSDRVGLGIVGAF